MEQSNVQLGLDFFSLQWLMSFVGLIGLFFILFFSIFRRKQFALSVRNVFRNKRRTLITLLAVTAAVMGNVLIGTYFLRMFEGLREFNIRSQTAHLQYMRTDFYEKGASEPTSYLIEDTDEILTALRANKKFMDMVDVITVQTKFNGLATSGDKSISFLGTAVEPQKDLLLSSSDPYIEGLPLSAEKPYSVVLGAGLAKQLNVATGDNLVLLSTLVGGGLNALDASVGGIIRPLAKDYSNIIIKTTQEFAQELLYTQGGNRILVLLKETKDTDAARAIMQSIATANPQWDLQLYDWFQLQDFYRQVVSFFSSIFTVISALLFFLVVFLVLNTMTMSVFERFNEFGTLRSIGVKKQQLIYMIVNEGIIVGILGALIGIIASWLLGTAITRMGLEVSAPPGQSSGYPLNLTPMTNIGALKLLLISSLASIGTAFISSLFPAIKATRMKIVDCLRHN